MKMHLVKLLFSFLLLTIFSSQLFAQDLTGIWRGYFVTEGMDQYKFELQIEQNKDNRISGVSYSYLTTVFYGKASLTGYYNKKETSALVQEIKTLEVRMSGSSVACIMKCLFTYAKSGKEEFLEGTFTSMYEKSIPLMGVKRGGNCGGGKIYLRKVTTSDFYVEPFLRNKPEIKPQNPPENDIAKNTTPKTKIPTTQKPTVKKATPKPAPSKPIVKNPQPKTDTVKRITTPPVVIQEIPKKEVEKQVINIPPVIRDRENNLIQTLNVQNDEVVVKIYDNGEIDDDTISVYMDNQLVLSNKRLSASPLTITLKMGNENTEHTLVMVAENLGRIPPNTSLMIVHDGDKRYEVRITSTETKNAVVKFRYVKPK